uniref:hypothetical protein n=1 Tax=Lentibacillus cibarius TaxID=2583219 RepID=UPI0014865C18
MIAAFSWSGSNTYYRLKLEGMTQLQVSAYQMLFGTIGILAAIALVRCTGSPHSVTTVFWLVNAWRKANRQYYHRNCTSDRRHHCCTVFWKREVS